MENILSFLNNDSKKTRSKPGSSTKESMFFFFPRNVVLVFPDRKCYGFIYFLLYRCTILEIAWIPPRRIVGSDTSRKVILIENSLIFTGEKIKKICIEINFAPALQ